MVRPQEVLPVRRSPRRTTRRARAATLPLLTITLTSAPLAGDDELRAILSAQEAIRSLETSFVQTKVLSLFDETIESSGRIVIEKPDFYCWSYETPERRIFYVDGMRTGSLEPESGERDEVALDSRVGLATIIRSVTSIITGNLKDTTEAEYAIARNPAPRGHPSYTFRPLAEELQALFSEVTIRFDRRTRLARELEIVEPNGDTTRMEFDRWRVNVPVDRTALRR